MHNSHDGTHGAPAQQNRKATADGTPPRPAEAPRFHIPLVVEVRATELVEIEERDDEGACWLFQLREEILVLAGQDYYETTKFPNDDFSLVEVRREDGRMLERLIEKRGKKLAPVKRLPPTHGLSCHS